MCNSQSQGCSPFFNVINFVEYENRDYIYGLLYMQSYYTDGVRSWTLDVGLPYISSPLCGGVGCPIVYIGNGSMYISIGKLNFDFNGIDTLSIPVPREVFGALSFNSGYLDIMVLQFIPEMYYEASYIRSVDVVVWGEGAVVYASIETETYLVVILV